MGLFDFAKGMGKKLFDNDDEAPSKIKETLEKDNPGIEGLDVTYADGMMLRSVPNDFDSKTEVVLPCGESFRVSEVVQGDGGVLFLKLADGRGWAFDSKPGVGICAEKDPELPGPRSENSRGYWCPKETMWSTRTGGPLCSKTSEVPPLLSTPRVPSLPLAVS